MDGSPFSSQTHTYDAANRISSTGFAYNDAGQMTADGTLSYSWDRAGRLLDAGDSSYAYNGLAQRVQQTVSGVVTDYLLDVQPGLAKVVAAMTGVNTERFVHERGLLSQQDSAGDWQWMVADGLSSVRGVIDGAGFDPAYSVHYAPYGQSWGEQGTEQTPFGFTGEPTDDNGLVHLRARYYNPALGVFPSLDPVEGVLQRAMSLNRYAYVAGNVVSLVDPSGLFGEMPWVIDSCGLFFQFGGCDIERFGSVESSTSTDANEIKNILTREATQGGYCGGRILTEIALENNRGQVAVDILGDAVGNAGWNRPSEYDLVYDSSLGPDLPAAVTLRPSIEEYCIEATENEPHPLSCSSSVDAETGQIVWNRSRDSLECAAEYQSCLEQGSITDPNYFKIRVGWATFIQFLSRAFELRLPGSRVSGDLFAVLIEETIHAWQDRDFGQGQAPADSIALGGWEHQPKYYILNLHMSGFLRLSTGFRRSLCDQLYSPEFYEYTQGGELPQMPIPPGWPHADLWVTERAGDRHPACS